MRRPLPRSLIVFDLDGTLIDSVPDLTAAVNEFLGRHGYPGVVEGELRRMMGDGAAELLARSLAARQIAMPQGRVLELADDFLCFYDTYPHERTRLYPSVAECLQQLETRGYSLAVCTNKRTALAHSVLDQLGIRRYMATLAGADSTPWLKPHPAPLQLILDTLNRTASDCVVVGDSSNDIRIAQAVGAASIGCRYGYLKHPSELDDANAVIDHFEDLTQTIERL